MRREPRYLLISALCFLGFLLCMALIFSGCSSSRLGKALNVGVGVSAAADFATTRYGISQGAVEANPLMGQEAWRQAVIKAIGATGMIALANLIEGKGRETLAHVVRSIWIGVNVGAATWNLSQVQR
jgi:hypothetical protein